RGVNSVEFDPWVITHIGEEPECVGLDELERVVRLLHDVDAYHVEPRPVVAHGGATGAAEQVQDAGPRLDSLGGGHRSSALGSVPQTQPDSEHHVPNASPAFDAA